ncbi:hypothetical protein, partial [Vibrio anguillarum]|uniref:hypothetical protein n=1 Tax=Vibrio anguillarum TaxID=55601 RepID=UPI001BE41F19
SHTVEHRNLDKSVELNSMDMMGIRTFGRPKCVEPGACADQSLPSWANLEFISNRVEVTVLRNLGNSHEK